MKHLHKVKHEDDIDNLFKFFYVALYRENVKTYDFK